LEVGIYFFSRRVSNITMGKMAVAAGKAQRKRAAGARRSLKKLNSCALCGTTCTTIADREAHDRSKGHKGKVFMRDVAKRGAGGGRTAPAATAYRPDDKRQEQRSLMALACPRAAGNKGAYQTPRQKKKEFWQNKKEHKAAAAAAAWPSTGGTASCSAGEWQEWDERGRGLHRSGGGGGGGGGGGQDDPAPSPPRIASTDEIFPGYNALISGITPRAPGAPAFFIDRSPS